MPTINRIRVNNVKYNFGTQYYDDFTMRMYGRNTIYDLANGGGKSVLMLLLMQNLIPNCTLDDKQPVEKLFRDGCNNTTIHSLIEWKLDKHEGEEGYRYMTTGFCARRAKDRTVDESGNGESEGAGASSGVASVEYFNYVIFYNSYNKNDIINLPLVKNKEHISYQALRNYLLDLSHKNVELSVQIFDKKGEYQRFISGYGLHESQWEIIRGINKTEGHVRTYFENNYKTTRKVIEDLLIEEIIDKAFLVRTNKDEGNGSGMARLLISIREQLKSLAEKKRDIASYDHQASLIQLLFDRVKSFEGLFREKDEIEQTLADIYVTVKHENEAAEKERTAFSDAIDAASNEKSSVYEQLERVKVSIDMNILDAMAREIDGFGETVEKIKETCNEDERRLLLAEAGNEYLEYLEEKKRKDTVDEKLRLLDAPAGSGEDIHAIVANIKRHTDTALAGYDMDIEREEGSLSALEEELEMAEKELYTANKELAVSEGIETSATENSHILEEKLSALFTELGDKTFEDYSVKLARLSREKEKLSADEKALSEKIDTEKLRLAEAEKQRETNSALMIETGIRRKDAEERSRKYTENRSRIETLCRIYLGSEKADAATLEKAVGDKLMKLSADILEKEKRLAEAGARYKDILAGRLIEVTSGVEKVLTYLRTRHNIYAMTGMDYTASLPEDRRKEILSLVPQLPYGVVCSDFGKVANDQNIGDIDTGNEVVIIYNEAELGEGAIVISGATRDKAMLLHRGTEFFTDANSVEKLAAEKKAEMDILSDEVRSLRDMSEVAGEDQKLIRTLTSEDIINAGEEADRLSLEENRLILEKRETDSLIGRIKENILSFEEQLTDIFEKKEELEADIRILRRCEELSGLIDKDRERKEDALKDKSRLSQLLTGLEEKKRSLNTAAAELRSRVGRLKRERNEILDKWNGTYATYYVDGDYEVMTGSPESLAAAFDVCLGKFSDRFKEQESLRQFSDTLGNSMDRILRNIIKKDPGLVEKLEADQKNGKLLSADEEALNVLKNNLERDREELARAERTIGQRKSEYDKISGRIEYAVKNYTDAFGDFARIEDADDKLSEMQKAGELQLSEAKARYDEGLKKLREFDKKRRESDDIYKDVSRIVERNGIDTEKAVVLTADGYRENQFEETLLRYDNIQKSMEKARLELVRQKGRISESLTDMGVSGLATAVREDVQIPAGLAEAETLLESLREMLDVIRLEKERIGKSLQDMELLHDSFVDQCLDRCLDVKTELELLPGLSGIMMDDEKIEMIRLSIPYVKDEYMRERMAAYIDKVVDEADKINDDEGRLKYIRNSLSTKRLFGVIVTDMNKIKLSLYKRERIKEQSRYLKYEEAVGSTGQSQGIYIQFLISVINYISGMYDPLSMGSGTNTIFIDNPFGAAKDIYIWEPIFALLQSNRVQLVVPARGASPAITGRFDINYVLGQQQRGGREVTVVVNYESRTKEEELEYHELSFEQQTFTFI